jgi:Flp pilus assembly pilin Flp
LQPAIAGTVTLRVRLARHEMPLADGARKPGAFQECVMSGLRLMAKLARDDRGGEVLEYALIAGLIVVAAIAAITTVGSKVLARWTSLSNSV